MRCGDCLAIINGHVEEGCDTETWGVSLAIDHQTQGLRIVGLAEDAARYYPCPLREAELSVPRKLEQAQKRYDKVTALRERYLQESPAAATIFDFLERHWPTPVLSLSKGWSAASRVRSYPGLS